VGSGDRIDAGEAEPRPGLVGSVLVLEDAFAFVPRNPGSVVLDEEPIFVGVDPDHHVRTAELDRVPEQVLEDVAQPGSVRVDDRLLVEVGSQRRRLGPGRLPGVVGGRREQDRFALADRPSLPGERQEVVDDPVDPSHGHVGAVEVAEIAVLAGQFEPTLDHVQWVADVV